MKTCLLFIPLLIQFQIVAQHNHSADKPSVHGMMLMGNQTIYASHLPMFRSPHDYQIIIELKLLPETHQQYLADKLANPGETIYTLEPEVFVLPQMIRNPRIFKANIYRGHFERGGTKILDSIAVSISKVIYFKKFETPASKPATLEYILFGNEKEQYLAHRITAKPDFDENIFVLVAGNEISRQLLKKGYYIIKFNQSEERKELKWSDDVNAITEDNIVINFIRHKQLYIEFGDLE